MATGRAVGSIVGVAIAGIAGLHEERSLRVGTSGGVGRRGMPGNTIILLWTQPSILRCIFKRRPQKAAEAINKAKLPV
jgi:hypothetical protein